MKRANTRIEERTPTPSAWTARSWSGRPHGNHARLALTNAGNVNLRIPNQRFLRTTARRHPCSLGTTAVLPRSVPELLTETIKTTAEA